jgi:L-alanine-DL-glutamate epimerase-like enolase superfamily enzyme
MLGDMPLTRRQLLASAAAIPAFAAEQDFPRTVPDYERPLFDLKKHLKAPVKIASIELLRAGRDYFVRTTSTDGAAGVIQTKQVEDYVSIFYRRVVPMLVGKDARDLEALVDAVYQQHYKLAGQAFWCPVAFVEQSLWDLLGRVANKPVGELMGGVIRKEIPVYLSGSGRETTAEEEVDVYVRGVQETGAKAVKFKIGGRMSRNADAYPGRTKTMMPLARKRLGDNVIIYADANGSYDSKAGIQVGRMLEELKCGFFEEPCPWEELGETKRVADALKIPVAIGEQDASLWRFQWIAQTRVADIVQPDLNYNGGIMRAARVARIAREFGLPITPHNTQTDANGANILQFASAIPNIGAYMEFPYRGKPKRASWYTPNWEIRNGVIKVPTGPGLGVDFDPDYLRKAEKVTLAGV